MARDKLITIRVEGEKREAFNQLAKSHNTDTASLLYDFISQCLSGTIDISLVTGKKQWIDKLDNQIGSDRIDKLEATTQRLDNWIGALSERLNDWILRSDQRLTDSDQGLSEKIISLEHRLNALAMQLDSQELDSIDTDSQKDRQGENPDIEPVTTVEIADKFETAIEKVEAVTEIDESVDESGTSPLPNQETVETANTVESDSTIEPVTDAIGPVHGDTDSIGKPCKGMNAAEAYRYLTSKGVKVSEKTLSNWISKIKHIPMTDKGDAVSEYLILRDGRYYPIN